MTAWCRPARVALYALVGAAAMVVPKPAKAQETWADANYRYRRPLVVENAGGNAMASGDVISYSYIPGYGIFEGKGRADGKDVKIVYYNGTSNVDVPQALLPMGGSAAKVLFQLQTAIPGWQYLTENQSAGTSSYASLPAGQKISFTDQVDAPNDDATQVVTLPFQFPFKNGASNKLRVGIDGYVVPGGALVKRYDIDDPAKAATQFVIMPWTGDFAISDPATMGVYYAADASQAVVRWEVQTSAQGPVIAKFALILKPDGSIRFAYSDIAAAGGAQPQKYGVGLGDASLSIVNTVDGGDFGGHQDITYTQNPKPSVSGYRVYYGNLGDDGTTGRTLPDASHLVAYTFDDGNLNGWKAATGAAGDLENLTVENGVLVMDGTNTGGHPMVYAGSQTTMLQDATIYAKMRATGEREIGIMGRATDDASGYGTVIDGWGSQGGLMFRNAGTYDNFGGLTPYYADSSKWHYATLHMTGQNDAITLQAKAFTEGSSEPKSWMWETTPNADQPHLNSGAIGLTGWEGGGAKQYLDWAYAASVNAENATYSTGDETSNPNIGVLTGQVTFNGNPLKGATVTLTPTTGTAQTVTTDASGAYAISAQPGSYTVTFSTIYTGVFNPTTATTTLSGGQTQVMNASLTAADNIIPNPSFETPDPAAPSVKPLGWFRRSYGGIANPDDTNKNTVLAPWIYSSTVARTGTHSIGFEGTTSNIQSWEVESSAVATVNPDQRGQAALPRLPEGATIYYSFYYKKATANGQVSHRPRYVKADDVNQLIGGGTTTTATAAAADWTKLEGTYTMSDPDTYKYPNFLAYRIYGVSNPTGEPVYVDDVVVKVVSVPATATYHGVVQDSQGNPLPNTVVGVDIEGANPMADPTQTAVTDGVGRFTVTVTDADKPHYIQPWKYDWKLNASNPVKGGTSTVLDTYLAGPVTQLGNPADKVVLTYDPRPIINFGAGKSVIKVSTEDPNNKVAGITDMDPYSRWSSVGGDYPNGYNGMPQYFVVDLGQEMTFGTQINQVTVVSDPAAPLGWQIRVSNTPPDTLPAPALKTDLPTLEAYGTPVYISPNGTGPDVTPQADVLRYTFLEAGDRWADVVSNFSTQATGRYVMFLASKTRWNVSITEFQIGTAMGTITGKVVDSSNKPVSGAYVGQQVSGTAFAVTDDEGNYTLNAASAFPLTFSAHKPGEDATKVYGVSTEVTMNPGAPAPAVAPTLVVPSASANLVPQGAAATAYTALDPSADITNAASPASNAVDYDYGTRWTTQSIADPDQSITDAAPICFVADLGSTQTVNEVVINWENAEAGAFHVDTATSFDMTSRTGGNWTTVATVPVAKGYRPGGGSRIVDPVKFAPVQARYIRVSITKPGPFPANLSIWELQAGSVADAPLPPLSLATRALKIAGGLTQESADDKASFNTVNTGASANVTDVADALDLARKGK